MHLYLCLVRIKNASVAFTLNDFFETEGKKGRKRDREREREKKKRERVEETGKV